MKLVSAVMVTRNRPEFASQAVDGFLAQTYPNKELVIIDDADSPSFPNASTVEDDSLCRIAYYRLRERLTIPQKRNHALRLAYGEYLMHWDDDDWSAPERMADQVQRLEESGLAVTGYHSLLFYSDDGRGSKYVNDRSYALGTSLAYTREWLKAHPFRAGLENPNVGEDTTFVQEARREEQLISVDAGLLMVARTHKGNTSPRSSLAMEFRPVSLDALPTGFLESVAP